MVLVSLAGRRKNEKPVNFFSFSSQISQQIKMEEDEENTRAETNPQQQQEEHSEEEATIHHAEEAVAIPPTLIEGGDANEEAVNISVDIPPQHRPVPFTTSNNGTDLNSIIAMEQKMSTLNIGYDLDDAGDDDEKVGESSPAVDATPVATVEGEQSSPSKNALLTFGMDGEETVENPVSSFFSDSFVLIISLCKSTVK